MFTSISFYESYLRKDFCVLLLADSIFGTNKTLLNNISTSPLRLILKIYAGSLITVYGSLTLNYGVILIWIFSC